MNTCTSANDIGGFILKVICIINTLVVPLVFALAFIVFIIGIYRYFIAGAANEEKRQEGVKFVMYGLIGFVIMLSVWGLINLLVRTFGFGGQSQPPLPTFNVPGSSSSGSGSANTFTTTGNGTCRDSLDCDGSACINGRCDYTGGSSPSPSGPQPDPNEPIF